MDREANKASFVRVIRAWESQDVGNLRNLVAKSYVGHTSRGDRNFDGLAQRVREFAEEFPDVRFELEDQFSEGEVVVTRMSATATSAKSGGRVSLIGINISRFEDGLLAEEWPVWEFVSA